MKSRLVLILLPLVLILAFILRIYLLGGIPPGLTNDEADIGYDAYSILLTGKDQWGTFLPFDTFKGFGDYRLPVYTYLVVPAVSQFGLNAFAIRLPSAIFGTISVLLIFFIVRKLFQKSGINEELAGLFSAFIFSVSPWSVGLSRVGIESNVAIAILLGAILVFLYAIKKPWLLAVSSVLFALSIYTYTSYTLFTPLVIFVLCMFFRKELLKRRKMFFIASFVFLILVIPLFISKSTAGVRASQVSFINSQDNVGLLADLNDRRGSCSEKFPSVICKVTENKQMVFMNTFVRNYLNHFSPSFLYLNGTTTQFSMLPKRSLLYTFELILLISGLLYGVKEKSRSFLLVLVLLLLSPIPDSLTGDGHYSRASNMLPFIFIVEGVGVAYLWKVFSKQRKKILISGISIVALIGTFTVMSFFISYFSYFPKYHSTFSSYGYQDWAGIIAKKQGSYDKIYLSKYGNDTKQYVYYLLYTNYSPSKFQKKIDVSYTNSDGGWVSIDRIGNLYFTERIPSELELRKLKGQKVLLVTHPNELPKDFKGDEIIYDKNGNGIFEFAKASSLLEYYDKHSGINQ